MRTLPLRPALAALALLGATGCVHLGPRVLPSARFHYNEAVARSADEQMLLNLVRLRYRDDPLFLEIGSVVTHYTYGASASAGGTFRRGGGNEGGLATGIDYTEEPTVSYTPLQGKDFVSRLLAPIDPDNLFLLSQSGWSIERLLLCCVQRVNLLANAVAAAGPTPDYVPAYEDFHAAAAAFRRLQIAGRLQVIEREQERVLRLLPPPDGAGEGADADRIELRRLLGLDPARDTYRLVSGYAGEHDADEIAFAPRSLLAAMFFLSQAVEPPPGDVAAGLVTVTHDAAGQVFDWSHVVGRLLRIRSSDDPPEHPAVRVFYRGHWFYIDDADLNSKTTFNLLDFLFAIQAGGGGGQGPLLTLGVK